MEVSWRGPIILFFAAAFLSWATAILSAEISEDRSFDLATEIGKKISPPVSRFEVSKEELLREIEVGIQKVEQFKNVIALARRFNLRVYLFGGTAAGFAHYVKWDLLRKKGDARYQADRFDYDYTNIYRSTQDLDIVVDGPVSRVQGFETALVNQMPYVQGDKSAWEVRHLQETYRDKIPLLNNPNFSNQHTDSNSVGLIELTDPENGESRIRDLRDWRNFENPYFLQDILSGTLHYYFSTKHGETDYARSGYNPAIFSVIRYLTKVFQYELKIPAQDLQKILEVIHDFHVSNDIRTAYATNRIQVLSTNMIRHAVNLEYALDMIQALGLNLKMSVYGDKERIGSLGWWMNKAALPTKEIGTGDEKTAEELGIQIVSHETRDFLAWESITRAHTGDPNVLISRQGVSGEAAAYGNGFYTRMGRVGAIGTQLTIRFLVNPAARLGTDFTMHGDYVVFLNKAAFRVIPESLNMSLLEYFEMLQQGLEFDINDKALVWKLKRRILVQASTTSSDEIEKIADLVRNEISSYASGKKVNENFIFEWFYLDRSAQYREILVRWIFSRPNDDASTVARVLSLNHWMKHRDLVHTLIQRQQATSAFSGTFFKNPESAKYPELFINFCRQNQGNGEVLKEVFAYPHWISHPDHVHLVRKSEIRPKMLFDIYLASIEHYSAYPHYFLPIVRSDDLMEQVEHLMTRVHGLKGRGSLIVEFAKAGNSEARGAHLVQILKNGPSGFRISLLRRLVFQTGIGPYLVKTVFKDPIWINDPSMIELLLDRGGADREFVDHVFSQKIWIDYFARDDRFLKKLIQSRTVGRAIVEKIFAHPHFVPREDLALELIRSDPTARRPMVETVLVLPKWKVYTRLFFELVRWGGAEAELHAKHMNPLEWSLNPQVREIVEKSKSNLARLRFFCLEGIKNLSESMN